MVSLVGYVEHGEWANKLIIVIYSQFWVARRGLSDLEDGVMLVIHSLFWMGRWDMSDMANGLLIVIIQFMSYG